MWKENFYYSMYTYIFMQPLKQHQYVLYHNVQINIIIIIKNTKKALFKTSGHKYRIENTFNKLKSQNTFDIQRP